MLVGMVPQMDGYKDDVELKSTQILELNKSNDIVTQKEPQAIINKPQNNIDKTSEVSKINEQTEESLYEVSLANVSFGYNEETKDLYVKVQKGDFEIQYPSEEVLKLREYLQDVVDSNRKDKEEIV